MRPSTSKEGPPTQPQLPSIFSGSPLPNWPAPIPAGTLAPPPGPPAGPPVGPPAGPPVARAEGTEVRSGAAGPRVLTADAWLSPCVPA